ncbi:response regulator [Leptolyngbya sp. FACHB-261]|nr:response regulator [Leptolyngbya sp. FACHB-261]
MGLEGLRVLVIEDEPDSAELMTVILECDGAEVTAVGLARDALTALRSFKPDLLISSIELPDADVYTLIRKLRSNLLEQGSQTPALAVVGYAGAVSHKLVLAAGFQMCLSKPITPDQLVAAVLSLTERR